MPCRFINNKKVEIYDRVQEEKLPEPLEQAAKTVGREFLGDYITMVAASEQFRDQFGDWLATEENSEILDDVDQMLYLLNQSPTHEFSYENGEFVSRVNPRGDSSYTFLIDNGYLLADEINLPTTDQNMSMLDPGNEYSDRSVTYMDIEAAGSYETFFQEDLDYSDGVNLLEQVKEHINNQSPVRPIEGNFEALTAQERAELSSQLEEIWGASQTHPFRRLQMTDELAQESNYQIMKEVVSEWARREGLAQLHREISDQGRLQQQFDQFPGKPENKEEFDSIIHGANKILEGVKVVRDTRIGGPGAVIGTNPQSETEQQIRRDYEVASDKPLLVIGKGATTETVYHEIAHLYIDILGMDHPLIQNAINKLQGTSMMQEAEDQQYQTEEQTQKEALAIAIGRSADEIRSEEIPSARANSIVRLVERILRRVAEMLGINVDPVRTLARDIVYNKPRPGYGKPSEYTMYQQRAKGSERIKTAEDVERVIKEEQDRLSLRDSDHVYLFDSSGSVLEMEYSISGLSTRLTGRAFDPDETALQMALIEFRASETYASKYNEEGIGFYELDKEDQEHIQARAEEILEEWARSSEQGTQIHSIFEKNFKGKLDKEAYIKNLMDTENISREEASKIIENVVQESNSFTRAIERKQRKIAPNKKAKIFSEVMVADPVNSIAGTIDILVVYSDGSVDVYDIKTTGVYPSSKKFDRKINETYSYQMAGYLQLLRNRFGLSYNEVGIIPVYRNVDENNNLRGISVGFQTGGIHQLVKDMTNSKALGEALEIVAEEAMPTDMDTAEKYSEKTLEEIKDAKEDLLDKIRQVIDDLEQSESHYVRKEQQLDLVEDLRGLLTKISREDAESAFVKYLDEVVGNLKKLQARLDESNLSNAALRAVFEELTLYDSVDDIVQLANKGKLKYIGRDSKFGGTEYLHGIQGLKDTLYQRAEKMAFDRLAEAMAEHTDLGKISLIMKFRKEWEQGRKDEDGNWIQKPNKFDRKGFAGVLFSTQSPDYYMDGEKVSKVKWLEARDEYVSQRLKEMDQEKLWNRRVETAKNYLREVPKDINNVIHQWVLEPDLINNKIIRTFKRIIDHEDRRVQDQWRDVEKRAIPIIERGLEQAGVNTGLFRTNPEKALSFMLEHDENGPIPFIKGKYKAKWLLEWRRKNKEWREKYSSREIREKQSEWLEKHTTTKGNKRILKEEDKYLNDDWEELKKNPLYQLMINLVERGSKKVLHKRQDLYERSAFSDKEFIRLPSISKSRSERFFDKSAGGISRLGDELKEMVTFQADDVGIEEGKDQEGQNAATKRLDRHGRPVRKIPLYYRDDLGDSFEEHRRKVSYNVVQSIMADFHNVLQYESRTRMRENILLYQSALDLKDKNLQSKTLIRDDKQRISVSKTSESKKEWEDSINTKWYKVLDDLIEDRLYGVEKKYISNFLGMDGNKLLSNLFGFTGLMAMGANYAAMMPNILHGEIAMMIEAAAGRFIDNKSAAKGVGKYLEDWMDIVDDIGKIGETSKTNLLMELFNINRWIRGPQYRYMADNFFKRQASRLSGNELQESGEHLVQGTLMYAMMTRIKVKNKDGKYINKKGEVVDSYEEAMSLDEAFTRKVLVERDGKEMSLVKDEVKPTDKILKKRYLELDDNVYYTSISDDNLQTEEGRINGFQYVEDRIMEISAQLNGQYDSRKKSMSQRHALGQAAWMFRKWFPRGMERRWRGTFTQFMFEKPEDSDLGYWDETLQDYREGYWTTVWRYMLSGFTKTAFWKFAASKTGLENKEPPKWENATPREVQNVQRASKDFIYRQIAIIGAGLSFALAEGIEDDDYPKQRMALLVALWLRRLNTELAAYHSLSEFRRIMYSPAASVNVAQDVSEIFWEFVTMAEYKTSNRRRGFEAGDMKWWKGIQDITPFLRQFQRDLSDSYNYYGPPPGYDVFVDE